MTDYDRMTSAQMLRELKRQAAVIEEKDAMIEEKDARIREEESLWKTRDGKNRHSDPGTAYRMETLREILDDPYAIHVTTGLTKEQFNWVLARFTKFIREHEDELRLMRIEGGSRGSEPGNRCALGPEYALLLDLTRLRTNRTQADLGVEFGIDQSTVYDYLKEVDYILGRILPTGKNLYEAITRGEIDARKVVPKGRVLIDGCKTPAQRPSDSKAENEAFSGKKQRHMRNTLFAASIVGLIIWVSRSYPGKTHDMGVLGEERDDLNALLRALSGHLTLYGDKGFESMGKHIDWADTMTPKKDYENHPLTAADRAKNRKINEIRIMIEHVFARLKSYARLADPYNSDDARFAEELDVITGLVNLRVMWKRLGRRVRQGEPPPHWSTYFE